MRILPAFTLLLLLALMLMGTCMKTNNGDEEKKQATSKPDLTSIHPREVKPIFDIMRRYGEAERDERTQNAKHNVYQYLVVTIISRDEMDDAKNWNKVFPASFTKDDGDHKWRVVFLLNKKYHGLPFYNEQRSLHGEVHAIDLGPLERLMENFKADKGNNVYPLVVMYSHYIPCAQLPGLGYSCAEEIGNYAKGKMDEFRMLVGYTTFFHDTDIQSSWNFMRDGGVTAFERMVKKSNYKKTVELQLYPPSSVDGQDKTFQQEYFDNIMDIPASKCCTSGATEQQVTREKIVAFFVNDATYSCTSVSNAWRGFTERNRAELKKCMREQIDKRISYKCSECSTNNQRELSATKTLFKFYLGFSLSITQFLGKPKDPNNMYLPEWAEAVGCRWKEIYPKAPEDTLHLREKVMCANRFLNKATMCTATGSKRSWETANIHQEKYSEVSQPGSTKQERKLDNRN